MLHKDLTQEIIGAYYDVYNGTGRTYPEFVYERAMGRELERRGIPHRVQVEYELFYKERLVGVQRLDMLAAGKVVIELKVVPALARLHKAQAISYLKVTGCEVGLVCNFGSPSPEVRRVYFKRAAQSKVPRSGAWTSMELTTGLLTPELSYDVIGGLYEVHSVLGPGFIHRVYANAAYHELCLRGLEPLPHHAYQLYYRNEPIAEIKLNHLQIDERLMVFPVAVQDVNVLSINNLKAWMVAERVPLAILGNFYPERLQYKVLRAE